MAWGKLGSTTASATTDEVSSGTITANKIINNIYHVIKSGTANTRFRFNNDTGSNYASRSFVLVTEATQINQTSIFTHADTSGNAFGISYILNISGEEKLMIKQEVSNTSNGAGTAPTRHQGVAKWVNTSEQITEVDLINTDSGDFLTDSNLTVLGSEVTTSAGKPTNVQAGSRFEETDTRKMYHYGDYPTVSDDLTTDKGWVSNTGSWTYNATGDYIDFATITRSTTAQRIYIDVQDADYLGSGNNLSDSSWVARFKIRTGTQSSSTGNVLLYFGFSNNLEDSGTTQQSATMMMNFNGGANENNMQLSVSRANFETTGSPARVNSDVYSNPNLPYSTDLYMEMTRNGDVFTLKAYSDEYSTQATSTSVASATVTGISTLRYIKAFNDSEQAQSYTSGGARLYDMKIYNGVTSAGNTWKELGT